MDYVVSILTSKLFIANAVVSIGLLELALKEVKLLIQTKAEHKTRDDKFKPFKRNDLHLYYRPILYLYVPTLIVRLLVCAIAWALLAVIMKIVLIGQKRDDPLIGWKKWFCTWCCTICSKINLTALGCFFINTKNEFVNYEEYLGEGWDNNGVDYDKCGSIVANHQSWIDILVHMYRQLPSHVAKAATTKIPFVGIVATAAGCLFFDRGDKG